MAECAQQVRDKSQRLFGGTLWRKPSRSRCQYERHSIRSSCSLCTSYVVLSARREIRLHLAPSSRNPNPTCPSGTQSSAHNSHRWPLLPSQYVYLSSEGKHPKALRVQNCLAASPVDCTSATRASGHLSAEQYMPCLR